MTGWPDRNAIKRRISEGKPRLNRKIKSSWKSSIKEGQLTQIVKRKGARYRQTWISRKHNEN